MTVSSEIAYNPHQNPFQLNFFSVKLIGSIFQTDQFPKVGMGNELSIFNFDSLLSVNVMYLRLEKIFV